MRVTESQPVVTQIMGKKKHKLRKQSKENKLCPAGSDSSDEAGLLGATAGLGCPHISKSIGFAAMKKTIKQAGNFGECVTCARDILALNKSEKTENPKTGPVAESAVSLAEEESLSDTPEPTVWVCLQCGYQGCDRNSPEKHALKHYQTPRSSSHAIVVNTTTWSVWCYACDDEVFPDASKKLVEAVEFLRKQMAGFQSEPAGKQLSMRTESPGHEQAESAAALAKDEISKQIRKLKQLPAQLTTGLALPKVRGLSNLGNTCFFNAVMQNLSQTHCLEQMLIERTKKNSSYHLPASRITDNEDSDDDDVSEEDTDNANNKHSLDAIEIRLPESGTLTSSLLSFLSDMNNPSKNGILSPGSLFGQVCKKAPRFKGFQQQDSHELLRHLLDGIKAEEIKRGQKGILKVYGLSENPNLKKLDDETKAKIKGYGRLVKHTFIDSIFEGSFISTVFCEECKYPSQLLEPFLDISLPITEEKPLRPNNIWSSRKTPETSKAPIIKTSTSSTEIQATSKHMSKKAKKAARREKKKKKMLDRKEEQNSKEDTELQCSVSPEAGESQSNSEDWDSKSDADVEDNLESDMLKRENKKCEKTDCKSDTAAADNISDNKVEAAPDTFIPTVDAVMEKLINDVESLQVTEEIKTVDESEVHVDNASNEVNEIRETKCSKDKKQIRLDARIQATSALASRYKPSGHECSVLSCLNQFTSRELLTGNNKFGCEKCTSLKHENQEKEGKRETVYTNASKQVLIFSPPAVLTLHMKRFQQVGLSLRKVNRHVDFPLILDLAPYCSSLCQNVLVGQSQVLYSLYGVVEHSGRLNNGHYTAYVKVRTKSDLCMSFVNGSATNGFMLTRMLEKLSEMKCNSRKENSGVVTSNVSAGGDSGAEEPVGTAAAGVPEGHWFYISDSRVNQVTENAVLKCQAYMLFYERIL